MRASLAADRLYALSLRPQEWDGLREHAELALRWGPVADDPEAPAARHWFLLVVEARVRLPAGDPLAATHPQGLEVMRCGWEAELALPVALPAAGVDDDPALVGALLGKAADAVNDLAARAGLEPLLTPAMQTALLADRG
jgi:hypothetical protein